MDSDRFVLIGRHRDGSLESHAEPDEYGVMMVIYRNDYPDMTWEAVYDSEDGVVISGDNFDRLSNAFEHSMDRECADESRHERGLRVPDGYE